MALGGRKPTPAAVKKLRGNPGHRPIAPSAEAPAGRPKMPKGLSRGARAVWRQLAPELVRMGVLSIVDGGLFATYCTAVADFDEASQHLSEEGYVIKSPTGYPLQNPWLSIRKNAAREIARVAPEFGLSASARTRVHVDPPAQPTDADERFLFPGARARSAS